MATNQRFLDQANQHFNKSNFQFITKNYKLTLKKSLTFNLLLRTMENKYLIKSKFLSFKLIIKNHKLTLEKFLTFNLSSRIMN